MCQLVLTSPLLLVLCLVPVVELVLSSSAVVQ
jgi:hypothetical protein